MATENIGGIDVVIQAHDAAYTAAMRRAALTARATGQQIRQAFAAAPMMSGLAQFGAQADRIFTGVGNRARLLGRDLRSFQFSFAGALGGIAGAFSGQAFLQQAGGFEQQLDVLAAISRATANDLGLVEEQALALGRATARSANDIAGAQLELTKMGFTMRQVLALTPAVTNLSIAADMDVAAAAHTAGAIMRQFRLEADDMTNIMDVIMRGANQSAADVSDFAGSLRYAGAMAAAANMDLETTVGLLAMASNAGMEGFMAGTSLRSLVGDFNTPMPIAAQIFRRFNIELRDSQGNLRNIVDLIEEVNTKIPASLIGPPLFEVDSANLLNALRGMGAGDIRAQIDDLRINQVGEAAHTAEARMLGLKGAVETLGGAFETLLIKIGESGFLKSATDITRAITSWVEGMSEARLQTLAFVSAIGVAAVAMGPLLFAVGAILTILTSPEGLLFGLAAVTSAFHVWTRVAAEIRGVQAAMEAAAEPSRRIAEINGQLANATDAVAAALRNERHELTETLRVQAQAADAAADQAEAQRQRERNSFVNRALWGTGFFADLGETARAAMSGNPTAMERAIELRAQAEQAAAIFDQATRSSSGTDAAQAQSVANPRAPRPPPVPHMQRFMGFTPDQSIARETEQLRRLAAVAAQGAMALEDLQEAMSIREQSRDQFTGAITITEGRAQEIVRERRALRLQTEMGRLRHETSLTIAEQQRLTEAANQGAIAYERMQIAAQLMRQIPGMGLQDALNMAEEIRRSNEQLDRAVTRMQRWAQTFQAIGDRIAGAFEEAIVQGGSLGDVLKSLARDLLMLVLRAAVLEPLARSIGNGLNRMFGGGGQSSQSGGGGQGGGFFGSILSAIGSFFGGGFAAGGQLGAGKWGIVGENGPELIRGGRHGATIVPLTANSNRPGGMMVDARAYINAAGADPAAIARLEAGLARRDAQLPKQIEAGVWNMHKRGRAWA